MADLSISIRNYIDNVIRLNAKDIEQCAKSREWFLERIKTEVNARTNQPILFAEEPFVKFGSYFKGTKVTDVDEYDILVVIDTANGHYYKNGSIVGYGEGSANPNHIFDPIMLKPDGSGVSSKTLKEWFCCIATDIVKAYGGTPPKIDGSAIIVRIESKDLSIDLVPAVVINRTIDNKRFYCICHNDYNDQWTSTCPPDDLARIANIAKGKDDFKNIIRICKRIKDQYTLHTSSFAIETAVINYVAANGNYYWNGNGLASNTIACIDAVGNAINTGKIFDPFDAIENLIDETINYHNDAKQFKNVAYTINSQNAAIANASQDSLDTYINALFDNALA